MYKLDVWDREHTGWDYFKEMSKNLYVLILTASVVYGVILTMWAANVAADWEVTWPRIFGYFMIPLVGIFVVKVSNNPLASLIGYAIVAIPLGFLIGPALALYTVASVAKIFITSTLVVVTMGFIGIAIPESLESWQGPLLGLMVMLICGYLIVPIAGMFGVEVEGALTWLDWGGVIIFSASTIYDFNRAFKVPRTTKNGIDVGLAIYLNWLNIFLRLLSLRGSRK